MGEEIMVTSQSDVLVGYTICFVGTCLVACLVYLHYSYLKKRHGGTPISIIKGLFSNDPLFEDMYKTLQYWRRINANSLWARVKKYIYASIFFTEMAFFVFLTLFAMTLMPIWFAIYVVYHIAKFVGDTLKLILEHFNYSREKRNRLLKITLVALLSTCLLIAASIVIYKAYWHGTIQLNKVEVIKNGGIGSDWKFSASALGQKIEKPGDFIRAGNETQVDVYVSAIEVDKYSDVGAGIFYASNFGVTQSRSITVTIYEDNGKGAGKSADVRFSFTIR
jgi:hypothetical protein